MCVGDALCKSGKVGKKRDIEAENVSGKIFLTPMPLTALSELEFVEREVSSGNIIILRVTPLASKNLEDVKRAVIKLHRFIESIGGDIGRLGEERIVLCPPNVKLRRASEIMAGGHPRAGTC